MNGQEIKILFIEDEDLLRSLFGEISYLDSEIKYNIVNAIDLKSGLEKIKTENPDLIILDLILPYDKNSASSDEDFSPRMGINLLKEIKKDNQYKQIPVIVFSNLNDPEIKKETLEDGAEEYLVKSETTPEKLLETIKSLIRK